jgi:tagatose-1,6-bisphosphate aldolase
VLHAEGEAAAILAVATAQAEALRMVGEAANTEEGQKAVQLDLATKAIAAREAIAKESSVVLLPDGSTEAANVVAQAMSIINTLNKGGPGNGMAGK